MDRLIFNGATIETGTDSYRFAHTIAQQTLPIRGLNTTTRGNVAASGGVAVSFADPGKQFGVDL
jgi:hypothetical protein